MIPDAADKRRMTITEFLEARIAEDETVARDAIANGEGALDWADDGDPTDIHIARHDPARVLAECAAKRAVIVYSPPKTLQHLAAIYADHPDYQQEWAPRG